MNLDDLSTDWQQQSLPDSLSPAQFKHMIEQRSSHSLFRYARKNRRRLWIFGGACVGGIVLLAAASNGFSETGSLLALAKLLGFQLIVGLLFWSFTCKVSVDGLGDQLEARLLLIQRNLRLRLGLELAILVGLFPLLVFLNHLLNPGSLPELFPWLATGGLGLVLVAGLLIGWYGPHVRQVKEALEEVRGLG